jgi:hypothetical protein
LKIFSNLRPGHIEKTLKNIDLATFDIRKELSMMKLEIKALWNGRMTKEELQSLNKHQIAPAIKREFTLMSQISDVEEIQKH